MANVDFAVTISVLECLRYNSLYNGLIRSARTRCSGDGVIYRCMAQGERELDQQVYRGTARVEERHKGGLGEMMKASNRFCYVMHARFRLAQTFSCKTPLWMDRDRRWWSLRNSSSCQFSFNCCCSGPSCTNSFALGPTKASQSALKSPTAFSVAAAKKSQQLSTTDESFRRSEGETA